MSRIYNIRHSDSSVPSILINPGEVDGVGGSQANSSLVLPGNGRLSYGENINENFLKILENFASPERGLQSITIHTANNNGLLGTHYFTIFEDLSNDLTPGFSITISASTGSINDGGYTVASSSYDLNNNLTTVIVNENFSDDSALVLGDISFTIIEPDPAMVAPPYNIGQLWFNKTSDLLYVYKLVLPGIHQWRHAGDLGSITIAPTNPETGDLWYDEAIDQLKIFDISWKSVADRYVLKSGDTLDTSAILNFGTHTIFNGNGGDANIGSQLESDSTLVLSSAIDVRLNIDSTNDSNGSFVLGKGLNNSNSTPLLTVLNTGLIQSDINAYESLVIADNDIPNKKFVIDEISSTISTSGAIINLSDGNFDLASNTNNATNNAATIELRELNHAGAQTGITAESPRLSLTWFGRGATQLALSSTGDMKIVDSTGLSYSPLYVSEIFENDITLSSKYLGILDKAVDSDLLDGFNLDVNNVGDTVVSRDFFGDINARLFRSSFNEELVVPPVNADIAFRNDSGADNYIRFMSKSIFKQFMDLDTVIPGAVLTYTSTVLPTGYFKCNGAAISRVTYANLFNVIGTLYGIGDGINTFNLPDFRGYFIRGWDDGRGIDPGRILGSNQADQVIIHSHEAQSGNATSLFFPAIASNQTFGGGSFDDTLIKYNTSSVGGSETRPKNIALMLCIKY